MWPLSQIVFSRIQELIYFIMQQKCIESMLGARNSLLDIVNTTVKKKKIYKVPTLIEFGGRYVKKK